MPAKRRKKPSTTKAKGKTQRRSGPKKGSLTCCLGCIGIQLIAAGLFAGFFFAVFRLYAFQRPDLPSDFRRSLEETPDALWFLIAATALAYIAAGIGILARKMWALYLFVIFSGLGIGLTGMFAFETKSYFSLINILLQIVPLAYVLSPNIRRRFT